MGSFESDIHEGIRRGDEAQLLRIEADNRIKALERSKSIVLDGSPSGYTICVEHGDLVRCVDVNGAWVEAAGICEFCWKAASARRQVAPGPGVDVRPEEETAIEASVDGGGQGPSGPVGHVQGVPSSHGVDGNESGRAQMQPLAPRGDSGASGGDPWDVIFGFPASELRR